MVREPLFSTARGTASRCIPISSWDFVTYVGIRRSGYGLILLNSNAPSHFLLTNAIGIVNRSQLSAVKSILRNSPGRAWMILLHH